MSAYIAPNLGPNPQDPASTLYQFIDTQPPDQYPVNPDSSLSHFTTRQYVPTAITNTFPIKVTIPGSNFANGQPLRTSMFITVPFASATGMVQLNNLMVYAQQCTADTFLLYDVYGYAIDGTSFTPYVQGGQFTVVGNPLVVNPSNFPPAGVVSAGSDFS
jgi:hypothetical protein